MGSVDESIQIYPDLFLNGSSITSNIYYYPAYHAFLYLCIGDLVNQLSIHSFGYPSCFLTATHCIRVV